MDNKFWRETDGQRPRPVQARQAGRQAGWQQQQQADTPLWNDINVFAVGRLILERNLLEPF